MTDPTGLKDEMVRRYSALWGAVHSSLVEENQFFHIILIQRAAPVRDLRWVRRSVKDAPTSKTGDIALGRG